MLFKRCSTLVLTMVACTVVAQAQTSQTTGAIKGTITSKKGGAVKGATLVIRSTETGYSKTLVTDSNGAYSFSYLPVGPYEMTATAPGLRAAKDNLIRVALGQTTTQNFSMDVVQAAATVEVIATSAVVDTAQVSNVTSISQEMVEAVPLNGRNFTDLVLLTPGAATNSQGYRTSVEGARGVMNNLQIDGASFNSKFVTEQRGGTRVPFTFGADTIRELQVVTNAYDAQYGDAAGAIINAITKSGNNDITFSAMLQLRPESMVARVRDVPSDPTGKINVRSAQERNFSQLQGNFNIGGPIIKDKLFYFVGVESYHYKQDSAPSIVPSLSAGNSMADYTTFANGLGKRLITTNDGRSLIEESTSPWTNDITNTVAFARLDWFINNDHRLYVRLNSQNYGGDNNTNPQQKLNNKAESNNSRVESKSISLVAELSSTFSNNFANEFRIQTSSEKRPTFANSTNSSEIAVGGVTFGQYYIDPRNTNEDLLQIIDNLTWIKDDWTVKGGFNLQNVTMDNTYYPNKNGSFSFGSIAAANQWALGSTGVWNSSTLIGSGNSIYRQSYSPLDGHLNFKSKMMAGYVNAQYNGFFDRRLMLSLGVRHTTEKWDGNPNPNPALAGLDAMPDNKMTDPRFGFSFDVFGNAKTVVRGGYGYFSIGNPGQTASGGIMNNGINMVSYAPQVASSSNAATSALWKTGVLSAAQRINSSNRVFALPGSSLAALFAGTADVTPIDPDSKMTQARRTSLGVEQDLGNGFKAGVTMKYAKFYNMQYAVNINMAQQHLVGTSWVNDGTFYNDGYATKVNHFSRSTATRPGTAIVRGRTLNLTGMGDVYLSKTDGTGDYKALMFEASRTSSEGLGFQFSTTFSKATDNNSNEVGTLTSSGTRTTNPADPLSTSAPSDNDVRTRSVLALYAPAIYGFRLSGVATYNTGRPFTATDVVDQTGDNTNDPAAGYGGRNGQRYPSQKYFDLRISRPFQITKKLKLEGIIDIYNVFNWANFSTGYTSPIATNVTTGVVTPQVNYRLLNYSDARTREMQFTVKVTY